MCETCIDRCFLGALSMDDDAERPVVDPEKCVGCGVCTMTSQTEALKLHRFDRPSKPFDTAIELGVTVARENDRL
jgi:MinD superfamily P-loop ATPase